jgi:hypothetical protein
LVGEHSGEAWVDVGVLRYAVELYEDGMFVGRRVGFRRGRDSIEVFVPGRRFTALVHIERDGRVRCNLSA